MSYCKHCGKPLILSNGQCIYCHKKPSDPVEEGGEKTPYYGTANHRQGKRREYEAKNTRNIWIIGIIFAILLILLYILTSSLLSKEKTPPTKETAIEKTVHYVSCPQDITGNYFVRMMKGREDINATIKIYKEDSKYAMNIYSSSITKKYAISYDSSTGKIFSQELGSGTVRIKELTNEIEITFEGWKLVK